MNKTAVALLRNSIPEETLLAKTQAWQKECLSVLAMAEFAALFCTAFKADQYNTSAMESWSSHYKHK